VIIALTFVLCLAVILFYKYNKNNKSLPKNWIISIIVLLFLCTGSSLVAALILSDMNDFIGYSIFILSFVMIVFMLALFLIKNDFALGNQVNFYIFFIKNLLFFFTKATDFFFTLGFPSFHLRS